MTILRKCPICSDPMTATANIRTRHCDKLSCKKAYRKMHPPRRPNYVERKAITEELIAMGTLTCKTCGGQFNYEGISASGETIRKLRSRKQKHCSTACANYTSSRGVYGKADLKSLPADKLKQWHLLRKDAKNIVLWRNRIKTLIAFIQRYQDTGGEGLTLNQYYEAMELHDYITHPSLGLERYISYRATGDFPRVLSKQEQTA